MPPARLAFLGTPDFAAEILEYIFTEKLAEITSVWTQPDKPSGRGQSLNSSPVKIKALKLGLKVHQPKNFKEENWNSVLAVDNADLGFITAYGQLLPPDFFNTPKSGMFNLHFSLLPKWRGASPLQSAILAGDVSTGVSLQKIVREMDKGDIALSAEFPLEGLNLEAAFSRSMDYARPMLKKFLSEFPESARSLKAQDEASATFCRKIHKQSGKITAALSAEQVLRMSRAYDGWPGIFFIKQNIKYDLLAVEIIPGGDFPAGTLYSPSAGVLVLACLQGDVKINIIRKEGKKAIAVKDFLNGRPFELPSLIDA